MNSLKKNFQNFKKKLDVPIHLYMISLARFKMNGILNLVTPQLEIKKGKIKNIKSLTQIYKNFKNFFYIKILKYNFNFKIKHDYQNIRNRTYSWDDCILWFSFDWAKQPLIFIFKNFL